MDSSCPVPSTGLLSQGRSANITRIKTSLYPVRTTCQAVVNALHVALHLILQKLYELGFVIIVLIWTHEIHHDKVT